MWDMSCANNTRCSLSKGTQSDGLISDTSTEELTGSGSSTENFKECQDFEKLVGKLPINLQTPAKVSPHLTNHRHKSHISIAKGSTEQHHESQYMTNLIRVESSIGLHGMQTKCRSYIRWSVLLSFGTLLWIALWITDIFNPNPFLKEDLATAKKVTQRAETLTQPPQPLPTTSWFFDFWNYAWGAIICGTTFEVVVILCFVTVLFYLESCTRNGTTRRLYYEKIYKTLLNTGAKPNTTVQTSCHLNSSAEKLGSIEPETRSCGDVRNLIEQHEIKINSQLGEKRKQRFNQRESSPIQNRTSKSLRGDNVNNHRKRSRQLTSCKNYSNFSHRRDNMSQDVVMSGLIFNKSNFNLNHVSPVMRNDKTQSVVEHSNLSCSVFNKSTSFMTEKIETWFELPSNPAEKVTHSFDTELDRYFKAQLTTPFHLSEGPSKDLQRVGDARINCDFGEKCNTLMSNSNYNQGIISSSPAFRRFLVNLAKDRMSNSYLSK